MKDFTVVGKLGQGSFGQVIKVHRHSDRKEYALKRMKINRLKEKDIENALNEIRILASIDDPYIIKYKEAFYDAGLQSVCIIMEFANGGDLQSKIESHFKKGTWFSQDEVWGVAHDLFNGLKALQDKKILHRDIKSANVFFVDGVAKLGDMNVSKVTECSLAYTQTGTPYYASPEVWKEEPYSYKSDIWSLGCVLYEMCTLKPPFRARNIEQLYRKVTKGSFQRIPMKYTPSLANLIADCLVVDVKKRANLDTLMQIAAMHKPKSQKSLQNCSSDKALLQTIKLPKNLNELNQILPKPQYEQSSEGNLSKRDKRPSSAKSPNFLDLFMVKRIRPQSRDGISPRPLHQIRSEKVLPDVVVPQEPISTKVLPEVPSFKSIIHSHENPADPRAQLKRRQRYEKQKQYLAQISAKKRPGIQLNLLSPTNIVRII